MRTLIEFFNSITQVHAADFINGKRLDNCKVRYVMLKPYAGDLKGEQLAHTAKRAFWI